MSLGSRLDRIMAESQIFARRHIPGAEAAAIANTSSKLCRAAEAGADPFEIIAVHEAGHTVVALAHGIKVQEVCASRRGWGAVMFNPESTATLPNCIAVLLAGNVAMQVFCPEYREHLATSDDVLAEALAQARKPLAESNLMLTDEPLVLRMILRSNPALDDATVTGIYRGTEAELFGMMERPEIRDRIGQFASELIEHEFLWGDEVETLFACFPPVKPGASS